MHEHSSSAGGFPSGTQTIAFRETPMVGSLGCPGKRVLVGPGLRLRDLGEGLSSGSGLDTVRKQG